MPFATLAWEGRRATFFRTEVRAALHIVDHGDVTPVWMTGSYAGAMGQPQFMPSAYLRHAVRVEGNGRRDIRTSAPDKLASIANADDNPGAHRPATQADRQTRLPMRTHPLGCIRLAPTAQSFPGKFRLKAEGCPRHGDHT
jgi:hypothetical protein